MVRRKNEKYLRCLRTPATTNRSDLDEIYHFFYIIIKLFSSKVSVSDIDVDFLPIIHEIVKTIEKDPQVKKYIF